MRKSDTPTAMLVIGPTVETVRAAREAIMAITEANADNKTRQAALRAFTEVTKVDHATVSNCNFSTK